jgi:hypothetical protein
MKKLFGAIVLVLALSGCSKQREIVLQEEVNSLRLELSASKRDNHDKLREINTYIAFMQSRGDEIEQELGKGSDTEAIYNGIIAKLKRDLAMKALESDSLKGQAVLHKGVNDTLRMILNLQADEIKGVAAVLNATKQELRRIDEEIKQLAVENELQNGDPDHRRVLTLEKAAKRTQQAIEKSKSL